MNDIQRMAESFQEQLKHELNSFLVEQKQRFPEDEILKIDMHCHDYNSDVPDELLGRILNVPETWLKTEKLVETLTRNKVDVITITNHNNARSCFELNSQGTDVLVGTEFSCMVPDFNVGIHVLTYGFDKEQERILNKLRHNVYNFQRYALSNDIPTVWAHPLYHYTTNGVPSMDFFNKMGLIFERFEVLNGQRDTWQNMLVKYWIDSMTPEKIDAFAEQYDINPKLYCKNPYKKSLTGGSDSHMGIFSGQTGTYLHVPNLQERLKTTKPSVLALEAIRRGDMAPFGNHQNFEKLTIAFLDYVCQIAMHKKDPGLMRILLHKGYTMDKLLALFVTNTFTELQNHKVTMRFLELFHNCFTGKAPGLTQRLMVHKVYKPVFDSAAKIAHARYLTGEEMVNMINNHLNAISDRLSIILHDRLDAKVEKIKKNGIFENTDLNELIEKLEIPIYFRTLFGKGGKNKGGKSSARMVNFDVGEFLDGLSFPFLASGTILAANFTSARVMYNNRELLKSFSKNIGRLHHPERLLWMTDTYEDQNGVSMFLKEVHQEIKKRNLPIDILVCSSAVEPDDHLIVLKPMAEYTLPFYQNQKIRIPNFVEIHNLFLNNEYDRIVCSTEGIMGFMSLYLKHAYSVKTYFYMHTDWLMFARKALNLDIHNLNRVRRFFRAYYKMFDGLFVLNSDHQKWLTGSDMGIDKDKVHLTAHWVDDIFVPKEVRKEDLFEIDVKDNVLLFAGRLSTEKGVMDIPYVYDQLKESIPNLKIVFAGSGPAEARLKEALPDARFLGWVDHKDLPAIYSSADLLLLPSRFDTFSCVVLEAMSCGLPVVAYKTKGPKDIIKHMTTGYLVANKNEMVLRIMDFFNDASLQSSFSKQSVLSARTYRPKSILDRFLGDVELHETEYEAVTV